MSQIIDINKNLKIKIKDSIFYDVDYNGEVNDEEKEFNVYGRYDDILYNLSYDDVTKYDSDNYSSNINDISFPTIYIYYRNSLVLSISGLELLDFYFPSAGYEDPEGGDITYEDINIYNKLTVSYIKEDIEYIFGKLFDRYIFDDFDCIFENEFANFIGDIVSYIEDEEDDNIDEDDYYLN